jgi:hypothetical protein
MAKFIQKEKIEMNSAQELFRRMDALEKRMADLTKKVKELDKPKVTRSSTPKPKKS